ncbi:MAG: hypothetical protein AAF587_02510 [Bacteroidota bacterium]
MANTPAKLQKLSIIPYSDPGFSSTAGSPYNVMINPSKISQEYKVAYSKQEALGANGVPPKFSSISPETVKLEIMLDATGVIDKSRRDLAKELSNLKKAVYTYQGDIHSPYFVKLSWGNWLFKGRLESMNVEYTLFAPNANPLRAKVSLAFIQYIDSATLFKAADNQSPDLTHMEVVRVGDTLPQMSYRIYGDSQYYLQVARLNNLVNVRDLRPGSKLIFPPLI